MKRKGQPQPAVMIASPGATQTQLRAWAYLGAWEMVLDIVSEFPGILTQLHAFPADGNGHRPTPSATLRAAADSLSIDDLTRHARPAVNGAAPAKRTYTRRMTPKQIRAGRRTMTAAQRQEMAARMRKQWRAAKRAGLTSLGKKAKTKRGADAARA